MTDEQMELLFKRAAAGDYQAERQIDAWIAEALGPVCATAPLEAAASASVMTGFDDVECPCSGAMAY